MGVVGGGGGCCGGGGGDEVVDAGCLFCCRCKSGLGA